MNAFVVDVVDDDAMTTSIRFLLLSFFGGANPLTSTTVTCKANHDKAEKGKFRRRRRRRRSRHCILYCIVICYLRFVVCALALFDVSDDEALSVNVLPASSTDAVMQCH